MKYSVVLMLLMFGMLIGGNFTSTAAQEQPSTETSKAQPKGAVDGSAGPDSEKANMGPVEMRQKICAATLKDYDNKDCDALCTADCTKLGDSLSGCGLRRELSCH